MNQVLEVKYKNTYQYHNAKQPTNRVLVCVAGVSEGAFRWYESLPMLTEHFNVVLFNNPDVDGAPDKITFTVDDLAEEYQHILNLLEIDDYYLMGHSMGGFVAQRMYLNEPYKVNKLVLIGTSFGSFQSEVDVKNIMDTKNTILSSIDNFKNHQKLLKMQDYSFTAEFQNKHPEIIEKYLKEKTETYKMHKRSLVSHFVCGGRFSSVGETQKILCPTLVIHGSKDRMVNIDGGIKLAKTIPNARLWKIDGAGHTPFIENVNIMKDVIDFLINDAKVGEVLENDFILTPEMLEKDKNFRKNSRSITYANFFKELFLFEDIEKNFEKYMESFKSKM